MINWQYFPKSDSTPNHLDNVVKVFKKNERKIGSLENELNSDGVLEIISGGLKKARKKERGLKFRYYLAETEN